MAVWKKDDEIFRGSIVVGENRIFNPSDETLLENGWELIDAPSIKKTSEAFEAACDDFRNICFQIREYFEFESFRGGFDEMSLVYNSQKFMTLQGQALAQAWNASNQLCVYEAKKICLDQPDWWYQCWADAAAAAAADDDDDGNDENSGGADDDEA